MMKTLGFSAFAHDSAAALVIDDHVVAAAEEERFTREKHTGRFPRQAIQYCLSAAAIDANELDMVAFYVDPSPNSLRALGRLLELSFLWTKAHPFSLKNVLSRTRTQPRSLSRLSSPITSFLSMVRWGETIRRELKLDKRRPPVLVGVPHHSAHIGASYLISGFEDAAILVADQRGEWTTTTLAVGQDQQLQTLQTISLPDSLGSLYSAVTAFLGFRALSDEGKVMGLSSYGQPCYRPAFRRFLKIMPEGLFKLDTSFIDYTLAAWAGHFPQTLIRELGPPRAPGTALEDRHADIAKSLQHQIEDALLALCRYLEQRVGANRLCLAGGVALNSVANGRIAREMSGWRDVYVPPAPGDAGAALGAAVWAAIQLNGQPKITMPGPYLGPAYNAADCQQALDAAGLCYVQPRDVAETAAKLLSEGYILGWFQGRMEFGPRALGNRSVLASPSKVETRDKVNKLKGRELWRPLAPSILAHKAPEWFVEPGESPYMSFVKTVRSGKADQMAACVHVDGTARLHTVHHESNPRYWNLLRSFERLTGVPCVLNTSFNRRGEPIVCTPRDAVDSFMGMGLDYLIMGDFVAARQDIDLDLISHLGLADK